MDTIEKQSERLLRLLMRNKYSPKVIGESIKTTIASDNPEDTVNQIEIIVNNNASEQQILELLQIILKKQYSTK